MMKGKGGWGCTENLEGTLGFGTKLDLFLLLRSKMRPFLLPLLILMKFPEEIYDVHT